MFPSLVDVCLVCKAIPLEPQSRIRVQLSDQPERCGGRHPEPGRRRQVSTDRIVAKAGGGNHRRAQIAYAGMGKCSLTSFDARIMEVRPAPGVVRTTVLARCGAWRGVHPDRW
jgi:hypothetical protein